MDQAWPGPPAHKTNLIDFAGVADKCFTLAGWILRALPRESDRELLSRRLSSKIAGVRRGRLYLPSHFPPEVQALTKLTTGQLRESTSWFKANSGVRYRLKQSVSDYIHQVMPGGYLRTVNGNATVHKWQSEKVKPLPASDWPRLGTRSAWPSSPTFIEMLAMSKRGQTPLPLSRNPSRASRPVSLSLFNSVAELRSQVVRQQIVGIRSDIEVPKRYLGCFRYRWNMLILTCRHSLPIGLVRYLTGQWKRNPHNLWLREKVGLKTFLRSSESADFACIPPGPW